MIIADCPKCGGNGLDGGCDVCGHDGTVSRESTFLASEIESWTRGKSEQARRVQVDDAIAETSTELEAADVIILNLREVHETAKARVTEAEGRRWQPSAISWERRCASRLVRAERAVDAIVAREIEARARLLAPLDIEELFLASAGVVS